MSYATIIGIDHGNNMIKTVHCNFSSNLTANGKRQPLNKTDFLYWEGNYYTINSTKHAGFVPDKTDSARTGDVYFRLTLIAIAKELSATESYVKTATPENPMLIELAIGLPILHISKLKDKYEKYFEWGNKPITFQYGPDTYHIRITSAKVFPQGLSAACISDERIKTFRKLYSSYYIVDIGGYTMDCMLITRSAGVEDSKAATLSIGINNLVNDIQHDFSREFAAECEENVIIDALRGIPTGIPQNRIDLIHARQEEYARIICAELRDKQFDVSSIPTVFVGGGSILFEDALRKLAEINENSVFITDIHANAYGYQVLAEKMRQKDAQKKAAKEAEEALDNV